jgi:hypothetical protein
VIVTVTEVADAEDELVLEEFVCDDVDEEGVEFPPQAASRRARRHSTDTASQCFG